MGFPTTSAIKLLLADPIGAVGEAVFERALKPQSFHFMGEEKLMDDFSLAVETRRAGG